MLGVMTDITKPENVRLSTFPTPTNTSDLLSQDRTKRVKDAKSEAQKEIEEYRKQKEEEFKKYEKEVCRDDGVLSIGTINH